VCGGALPPLDPPPPVDPPVDPPPPPCGANFPYTLLVVIHGNNRKKNTRESTITKENTLLLL